MNIVFGGQDSTSSSPALRQSADSMLNPIQWPPLGSEPPPPTPHRHAHHASEPYGPRTHNNPSSAPWHMRQAFQQPVFSPLHLQHQGYTQFQYPPREVITPAEVYPPGGSYGRSRSPSRASAAGHKTGEDLHSPLAGDSLDSRRTFPRDTTAAFQSLPPQLRPHHGQFQQQQAREPAAAMRNDDAEDLRHHLYVPLEMHGVALKPFWECVQYLYGGPLQQLENLHRASYEDGTHTGSGERMESALGYVATASWLQLPAVAARAMVVVLSMLQWDTIASVLAFALDGGLGSALAVEDGSEMSCASSDDSLGKADIVGIPTHEPYSTELLHRLIDFMVHMFPPNFYTDAAAPQLASCPRLPPLPPAHESRSSRSDPRLSQIRFGELSVEDHGRPSLVTTTVSSILLSLPFPLLKCVLEHNGMVFQLGADTVASIMRQVVAEREVRRKRVLQARTVGQTNDGATLRLVQNLYLEERVEPSPHHGAGSRLARTKRGIDTPPSSGAASERI
ncbi:hypothetical protein LTR53_003301 [Teratosphaeriaceae sp. CCFEE 6253]|nr:hypothetical protein LTR53_003301 [Teratosphaeriaceae sp. CCFEE 6253]